MGKKTKKQAKRSEQREVLDHVVSDLIAAALVGAAGAVVRSDAFKRLLRRASARLRAR